MGDQVETTIDVKEEVSKLAKEPRDLLRFLLGRYVEAEEFKFSKDMEIAGMNKGDIPLSFDKLIASGFAFGSSAQPNVVRLNRARMDSLRSLGKI